MKYTRMKLRHGLFNIDKSWKKKRKDLKLDEMESDLDDDFIERWEDAKREDEVEKAKKKFEKDNAKKEEDGVKALTEDDLEKKIADVHEEYDRLKKERGKEVAHTKMKDEEKIVEAIVKLDQKLEMFRLKIHDKDQGKEVSLGTRCACIVDFS